MDITLTKPYETYVKNAVKAGQFDTPEAVIEQSLDIFKQYEEKLAWMRDAVQKGLDSDEEYTVDEVEKYLDQDLENMTEDA